MNSEIERKFLVKDASFIKESYQKKYFIQGFLNTNPHRVVRVRVTETDAFLTIKGITSKSGTTRFEWEKEIPVEEGKLLLQLCEEGVIEKHRYFVKKQNHIFEIDVFEGDNNGLTVAEVELSHENEKFETPNWLGKEVTGDSKYYNSSLSLNPFKNWT